MPPHNRRPPKRVTLRPIRRKSRPRYTAARGKLQIHYVDDPQIETNFSLNSRIEGHMPGNTHQPMLNLSSYCTLLRADHALSA